MGGAGERALHGLGVERMTFQTKLRGVFDNCDCTVLIALQKLFLLFITLKVISHFL